MSDPKTPESKPSGASSAKRPAKRELTMEHRLMLAFALMGIVLIGSTYLMPKPPEEAPKSASKAPATAASEIKPAPAPPVERKAGVEKTAPPKTASIAGATEETAVIETDLYRIEFTNRGAVARSWILKAFKDSNGKPLDLVNPKLQGKTVYPMAVRFHSGQSAEPLNTPLYAMRLIEGGIGIEFEYSVAPWYARKRLLFKKGSYLTTLESEVRNSGTPKPHLIYWRGGFGDASVIGAAAATSTVRFDLAANEVKLLTAADAGGAPGGYQAHRGRFSFAGIQDAYFAAVALPDTNRDFEIHSLSDSIENSIDGKYDPHPGVALGGDAVNRFEIFVGPKDTDLLKSISPRLEQLVDFGWFAFLAKPLFLALHWLNAGYIHNYGWTIVIITVIINFLLLPLKISSLKSMKKMSELQPQIAAINEKYRGMKMTDPRKQNQQAEVMELYKKHNVNPVGGCVPMALQIPFFIAFYKVLSAAIELRGASWLWVEDLSRPETIPIRILPVAMVVTQFIMQKMTPATSADPAQQRVMLMMPAFLGFMFYGVSSGLVLYWLTGNLVGILQQWFFNKTFHAPAAAPPAAAPKKKAK